MFFCMSQDLFCPNCGSKHEVNGRYCEYCGSDLEEVILQYKRKKLPIRYQAETQYSGPYQERTTQSNYQQPDYQDDYRGRRYRDSSGGFWDALLGILFFWMCCGPDCDGDCR